MPPSSPKKSVKIDKSEVEYIDLATYDFEDSVSHEAVAYGCYQNSNYFLKYNNIFSKKGLDYTQHKGSDYEVLAASIHREILGDSVPVTMGIYDAVGKRLGVASQKVESLEHTKEVADLFKHPENVRLWGMTLALAVFLEENDLHLNNVALDKMGRLVRYDFDRCFWPLTAKYVTGPRYNQEDLETCFALNSNMIEEFPYSKDMPYSWWVPLEQSYADYMDDHPHEEDAIKHFAYEAFYELATVPNEKWLKLIRKTMSSQKQTTAATNQAHFKMLDYLTKRQNTLQEVLKGSPSFCAYLLTNFEANGEGGPEKDAFINDIVMQQHDALLAPTELEVIRTFYMPRNIPSLTQISRSRLNAIMEQLFATLTGYNDDLINTNINLWKEQIQVCFIESGGNCWIQKSEFQYYKDMCDGIAICHYEQAAAEIANSKVYADTAASHECTEIVNQSATVARRLFS